MILLTSPLVTSVSYSLAQESRWQRQRESNLQRQRAQQDRIIQLKFRASKGGKKTAGANWAQHRVEVLAEANIGLVKPIARSLYGHVPAAVPMDDLVGAGIVGLIQAARQPQHTLESGRRSLMAW